MLTCLIQIQKKVTINRFIKTTIKSVVVEKMKKLAFLFAMFGIMLCDPISQERVPSIYDITFSFIDHSFVWASIVKNVSTDSQYSTYSVDFDAFYSGEVIYDSAKIFIGLYDGDSVVATDSGLLFNNGGGKKIYSGTRIMYNTKALFSMTHKKQYDLFLVGKTPYDGKTFTYRISGYK